MKYITVKHLLKDEYADAFAKIEDYAQVYPMSEETFEDKMMNLLDILLTAQKKGKPVEKIVGSDIQQFCESYFSDITVWDKVKMIAQNFLTLMLVVFGVEILDFFESGESDIFASQCNLGQYIVLLGLSILGLAFTLIFGKYFFVKYPKFYKVLPFVFFIVLIVVMIIMRKLDIFTVLVPRIIVIAVAGIYSLIGIAVRIVRHRRTNKLYKEAGNTDLH